MGDIKGKRDPVVRALNTVLSDTSTLEAEARRPPEVQTKDVGTDTPCWWDIRDSTQQQTGRREATKSNRLARSAEGGRRPQGGPSVEAEKLSSAEEDHPPKDDDIKLVNKRKKKAITKAEVPAATKPKPTKEPVGVKRKRLPKTQAVVLEKPTGNTTYADMVREIKTAVSQEALSFDITTRRAKSGNLILETNLKEHADDLASVLKRLLGESRSIRRPSPSVPLLLIGVEDSVDEKELARTLLEHDPDLKTSNVLKIQEGKNGVRTAIVRVPMIPGLNWLE